MIPAAFDYIRAGTAEEAVAALEEHGDEAKVLAGGHSLVPLMKLRLATPSVLVDVGRVPGMDRIVDRGDHISIGALCRHDAVHRSDVLVEGCPVIADTARQVGDPQVRHRGTIGGSVSHADPASDLPAALLAVGATFVARSARGEREIAAGDFFRGFLESSLAPTELLTEIRVPKVPGGLYLKVNRRAQDWAIVGVAVTRGPATTVALAHMGATPLRATAVEGALASGAAPSEAAALAAEGTDPSEDLNADADYRRHLARVLVERALVTLADGP